MGCVETITATRFPMQGELLGKRVRVCYHYDTKAVDKAVCVRDDREAPGVAIFLTDGGRYVLATECQYQPLDEGWRVVS